MTRSFIVAALLFAGATIGALVGCEDDAKVLVGEGGPCASILDCQAGLSCVASGGDGRTCKTASTSVPVTPDEDTGAPDGGVDAETADGEADAEVPDGSDAETPDGSDASGDAGDAG